MTPPAQAPSIDRLDERSKAHADKLDDLNKRLEAVEEKLDTIIKTLAEARGGWKTLMWIGGAGGVIGATLTKFAPWLATGN